MWVATYNIHITMWRLSMIQNEPVETNYSSCFKDIYYSLYTNSTSSRAESIVSDISKILLYKLLIEKGLADKNDLLSGQSIVNTLQTLMPDRYTSNDTFQLSDENIFDVITRLNNISLSNAPSHIIGDAFQSIIGPKIRGDKGQFFTPKELVECMVHIISPCGTDLIIDPACGTGGFLTESITQVHASSQEIKDGFQIVGIDKDRDMADMALATSTIIANDHTKVFNSNSLEMLADSHPLHSLLGSADIVLTNPPFGAKIGVSDKAILSLYDFGHNWTYSEKDQKWYRLDSLVKSQAPQVLFLELCIRLLKDGGRMAIVLPEGMFGNKSLGYIWDYLKSHGYIYGMIDCPRNTFQPSTDTKTNVLFFEKGTAFNSCFPVAVAKQCGHDKRGRTTNSMNEPWPNDYALIAQDYFVDNPVWWKKVIFSGYYCVPRYLIGKSEYAGQRNYTTIGKLISDKYIIKKSSKEIGSESYGTGSIPYIRTSDIINFELAADPANAVSEEIYERFSKSQNLEEGDILFIADGRYRIGKTAIITKYNIKCLVQSHIEILSLSKDAPFTPYEFLYLLNSDEVQEQIRSMVFIQSTIGTLGARINEIAIPLPDRTDEWNKKIHAFQYYIETRAECLYSLQANEHSFDL